jgi:hypothetical protein
MPEIRPRLGAFRVLRALFGFVFFGTAFFLSEVVRDWEVRFSATSLPLPRGRFTMMGCSLVHFAANLSPKGCLVETIT